MLMEQKNIRTYREVLSNTSYANGYRRALSAPMLSNLSSRKAFKACQVRLKPPESMFPSNPRTCRFVKSSQKAWGNRYENGGESVATARRNGCLLKLSRYPYTRIGKPILKRWSFVRVRFRIKPYRPATRLSNCVFTDAFRAEASFVCLKRHFRARPESASE